ncbi:MAG: hypothetical protein JXR37_22990 [Kiritimatiellae bacterium]|nr:hypothetical protein [Kiritimatiellia bacterium]
MNRRVCIVSALGIGLLAAAGTVRADRLAVTFNREGQSGKSTGYPPWDFAGFGIERVDYSKSTLDASFIENLNRAKLFILGPWSSEESQKALFSNRDYTAAISEFFKSGGLMFCMHIGEPYPHGSAQTYFKSIGVTLPDLPKAGTEQVAFAPGSADHALMTAPNALAKEDVKRAQSHGHWEKWPAAYKPLFVARANPEQALMLIREKILDRGTLILTRVSLHQEQSVRGIRLYSALVENALTCAFGRLEKGEAVAADEHGEGAVAAPAAPATTARRRANLLYLRGLAEKPWWNQAWPFRIPLLVSEPAGVRRYQAPLSVLHELPPGVKPSSIRVVTPWGEELPSQTRVVDAAKNRVEIVFAHDLAPHEHLPLFLYFGNPGAAAPAYESDIRVSQSETYYRIATPNILARFLKDAPVAVHLQPSGNVTGNQLARNYRRSGGAARPEDGLANAFSWAERVQDVTSRITEDGPVRTTLEYEGTCKGQRVAIAFTLYAAGRRVNCTMRAEKPLRIGGRSTCWLPGHGIEGGDALYFESAAGIRKLGINNSGEYVSTVVENLIKDLSEGWYAIHDTETGQTVGEIFERHATPALQVTVHTGLGYRVGTGVELSPAAWRGAFVPAAGGFGAVRDEYVDWKTPPVVHAAPIQPRTQTAPQVPVFGRNLLRYLETSTETPVEKSVDGYLRDAERVGANFVSVWPQKPIWKSGNATGRRTELLDELIQKAHARGIGVEIGIVHCTRRGFYSPPPQNEYLDKVRDREWFVGAARDISRYDVDVLHLQDENGYTLSSAQEAQALFRSRYKMEPAKKVTVADLKDPAVHNRALFEMDVYTECLRDMYNEARKYNKKAIITDQINVHHLVNISGGYNDMEAQAEFLDAKCMDLYHDANEDYKFWVKYLNGARNNRDPILMFSGYCVSQRTTERNQSYLLMWGADALATWYRGVIWPTLHETVRQDLVRLDYTGLGDMLVQSTPVKSVAVLRDKAAFVDGVKNGQWQTGGSTYEIRIRNIVKVKNLLTDIVFSRHFTPPTLAQYAVLVVPNNPVLSDKHAETIRGYVEAGGRVIIEGEGINHPAIQKLCGAVPKGRPAEKRGQVRATDGAFAFFGDVVPADIASPVIARFEDGSPAFAAATVGRGQVVYTPLIMSDKMVQPDLAAFYRALVRRLIGTLPLEVAGTHVNEVDTNLLGDGSRHILAIANLPYKERTVRVTFNVPVPPGSVVVDMTTGEQRAFAQTVDFNLPAGVVRFYYVGPQKLMQAPPAAETILAGADPAYCTRPAEQAMVLREGTQGRGAARKRKKEQGFTYVAVLTDKDDPNAPKHARVRGDEGIYDALQGRAGLKTEYIRDLDPETLAFYDAVLIPNIGWSGLPPVMAGGWEQAVHDYVENGGAVLLAHHAVGAKPPCADAPFPEIGRAGTWVQLQDMIVRAAHPLTDGASMRKRLPHMAKDPAFKAQMDATLMEPGTRFRCGYPDYIVLVPGPAGTTLVESEKADSGAGGDPVVVAGTVGKGKVVLCGFAIGAKSNTEEGVAAGGEESILVNAAYWLTER